MKVVKPRAIRPGATLGVVSPASTPKAELVAVGVARLEGLAGYRVRVFPRALDRGPLYYAGSLADRVGDLHAAFADDGIDGIVCTRGGWGSAELLPVSGCGADSGECEGICGGTAIRVRCRPGFGMRLGW